MFYTVEEITALIWKMPCLQRQPSPETNCSLWSVLNCYENKEHKLFNALFSFQLSFIALNSTKYNITEYY